MQRALGFLTVAVLWTGLSGNAQAAQSVKLQAALTPERLGQGTTISFGFQIATPARHVPPPLTGVEISYPIELGFALSELGLATCYARALEIFGPQGCPANSFMGYGTALAEIPIGPSILRETVQLAVVRSTNQDGHLALLIYAEGITPVSAQIVFPAVVSPAPAPFGGRLDMSIPLVPTLPETPDAAVVQFRSTLGPMHLHYHEHIHGRIVKYEPRGIPLPDRCPPGGFAFTAKFGFMDGSTAAARTSVPCPSAQHRHPDHLHL
jgi:hypothetical protein